MNPPTDTLLADNPHDEPDTLHVRVLGVDRQPVHWAEVRLVGNGSAPLDLRWDETTAHYRAEVPSSGRYVLSVSASGLAGQKRRVTLPQRSPVEFVLGREGSRYYYRGKVKTPFEPSELIALTLEASPDEELRLAKAAADLGFGEVVPTHEEIRQNHVWVFRPPHTLSPEDGKRLLDTLREQIPCLLAGPVVEMFEQRLVYLTHQFIVKFEAGVTGEQAERIAGEYGFRVIRGIAAASNAFLVEGEPTLDLRLLDAANRLAEEDSVEYAEPNAVMTSIHYAVDPGDSLFPRQWHLSLVRAPCAWQFLRACNGGGVAVGRHGDLTFGDAEIQIAVFDTGVKSVTVSRGTIAEHPEFQGSVTSGAAKVAAFYDAANMVTTNDEVDSDHGTGCAGIAAALTGNVDLATGEMEGVAGAAGNCRIVAIRRPRGYPILRWADAFVWMAGFDPGWVADGTTYCHGTVFPPLLAQGVDIHTSSVRIPDFGVMDDALDFLATRGRGGRGVVSFLAAGNTPARLFHPHNHTIADHDKVIAVAASTHRDLRAGYSCYDLAIGHCAPSSDVLDPAVTGATFIVTTDTVSSGTLAGHTGGPLSYREEFRGTSAAAPLVAGIAALMLSINPALSWWEIRDILRETAVKIDPANQDPVGRWTRDALGRPVFSQWYGYGRVDACAAVAAARGRIRAASPAHAEAGIGAALLEP